ncbi:unnamed protein product [Arabis nemorensis]|uniref:Uncharacterized protein n=1 Tax=Arabis nemorensis TaxID=586526 RepID=A0A565BE28_9BRAS|nr:unnamed protein product [Arabis nemorensis]
MTRLREEKKRRWILLREEPAVETVERREEPAVETVERREEEETPSVVTRMSDGAKRRGEVFCGEKEEKKENLG